MSSASGLVMPGTLSCTSSWLRTALSAKSPAAALSICRLLSWSPTSAAGPAAGARTASGSLFGVKLPLRPELPMRADGHPGPLPSASEGCSLCAHALPQAALQQHTRRVGAAMASLNTGAAGPQVAAQFSMAFLEKGLIGALSMCSSCVHCSLPSVLRAIARACHQCSCRHIFGLRQIPVKPRCVPGMSHQIDQGCSYSTAVRGVQHLLRSAEAAAGRAGPES